MNGDQVGISLEAVGHGGNWLAFSAVRVYIYGSPDHWADTGGTLLRTALVLLLA